MRAIIVTLVLALASPARADDAAPETPTSAQPPKRAAPRRWSIAVGPSVWAASVATTIKLGPVEVRRNVPFAQIVQYFDGGMSGALEARYGRFTGSGGFQYGRLATTKEIADGMGEVGASLTTLLVEGAVGYRVLGGTDARLSLELRTGVRHTGLDIEAMGTLGIGETTLAAQGAFHRSGTDYLIGARGRLRLGRRAALVATGDTRIAGDSYSTWSISGDLQVRATRWLIASAGWRVLETESTPITIRRNGPQLVVMINF
jgi:hypothetical protein